MAAAEDTTGAYVAFNETEGWSELNVQVLQHMREFLQAEGYIEAVIDATLCDDVGRIDRNQLAVEAAAPEAKEKILRQGRAGAKIPDRTANAEAEPRASGRKGRSRSRDRKEDKANEKAEPENESNRLHQEREHLQKQAEQLAEDRVQI